MGIGASYVVIPKATAYQIVAGDCGAIFTNRGAAGGVTFTLPSATELQAGWNCEFFNVVAQVITIASTPTDTLIVDSDAGADTIALASQIGQSARVVYDGTGFLVFPNPSAGTGTTAVRAVTIVS